MYGIRRRPVQPVPSSEKDGGDERARTANLRLAKPALSQLSYVPTDDFGFGIADFGIHDS